MPRPQLKKFYYFPKLPTEIRLMIWKMFIRPRIIQGRYSPKDKHCGQYQYYHADAADIKRSIYGGPVPSLLHINQETRSVAIKAGYKLLYSHPSKSSENQPWDVHTWVNCAIDTFYLPRLWLGLHAPGLHSTSRSEKETALYREVRHLGIRHEPVTRIRQGQGYAASFERGLGAFPNLSTLTVVPDDMASKQIGRCEFVSPKILPAGTTDDNIPRKQRKEYCKAGFIDLILRQIEIQLDKIEESKPNWKRPTVRAMSLEKVPQNKWLG